jgi:hypothetical protein
MQEQTCRRCGRTGLAGFHVPASPFGLAVERAERALGAELTADQLAAVAALFAGHDEPLPVECNDRAACERRAVPILTVTVADQTGRIYEHAVPADGESAVPDALAAAFVMTSEIEPGAYDWSAAERAAERVIA